MSRPCYAGCSYPMENCTCEPGLPPCTCEPHQGPLHVDPCPRRAYWDARLVRTIKPDWPWWMR